MKLSQLAVQLYTLRDHCRTAPELAESVGKLQKIGFRAVQVSGVGPIPEDEIARICRDAGLVICATHENNKTIIEEPQRVIDRLGKLGCRHTAYPYPHRTPSDEKDAHAFAAELDRAGAALRNAGMTLSYHNHALEFRKFGQRTWLEIIYAESDAKNLQGEIDTYWVQAGGEDPVRWCTRLHQRLPLLHLKDYGIDTNNQPATSAIGVGNLNWRAIIAAAEASGCEWYIVEQDNCPGDPFVSLGQSFAYVSSVLAER